LPFVGRRAAGILGEGEQGWQVAEEEIPRAAAEEE